MRRQIFLGLGNWKFADEFAGGEWEGKGMEMEIM
jgi:hypothetical protein